MPDSCPSTETIGARHSPLIIEMILHFHVGALPFDRIDFPACIEARDWMLANGLIEPADHGYGATYVPTQKGRAWVWMLCDTPLPEPEWIDRRARAARPSLRVK